jgi:hypothetical protein
MRDILSAALFLVLFFAGFGGVIAAVALGWWVMMGTYSRVGPGDFNAWWPVLAGRYKRHSIAFFVLLAVSATASILLEIIGKHLR